MTLRILLQQLHQMAGELGADTPVRLLITGRSTPLDSVTHLVRGSGDAVLLRATPYRKRATKEPELKIRQQGYVQAWRNRRIASGKCVRCGEDRGDSKTTSCNTCKEIRRLKRL